VQDWLRQRRVNVVLTGLAVAAAVSAWVSGVEAGGSSGRRRLVLLIVGGCLTGSGIVLASIQRWRSEQARRTAEQVALETEEELSVTLNGALAPITSYLGELAVETDPAERQALAGQLRQAVVDAAVRLTVPGSRSTFYALEPSGDSLLRVAYAGRSQPPRERFVAGTADGDFVLELVTRADLLFVEDVVRSPLVTPSTEGYATVIAVAVTAGRRRIGLLTVDALYPGDLSTTDVELVRVLANLLGSGLGEA
jgi:hypothetical protein